MGPLASERGCAALRPEGHPVLQVADNWQYMESDHEFMTAPVACLSHTSTGPACTGLGMAVVTISSTHWPAFDTRNSHARV